MINMFYGDEKRNDGGGAINVCKSDKKLWNFEILTNFRHFNFLLKNYSTSIVYIPMRI